jgi:hypothetical protein
LGISARLPAEPVSDTHIRNLVIPDRFYDNELVQSFKLTDFEGEVRTSSGKVPQTEADRRAHGAEA